MKRIVYFFTTAFYAVFDFRNHKVRSIIYSGLIVAIVVMIVSALVINKNNRDQVTEIGKSQIANESSSSINKKASSDYKKSMSIYRDYEQDDSKRTSAKRQADLIEGGDTTNFEERDPGQFQLDVLDKLLDKNASIKDAKKQMDMYSQFTAGETIWLFNNWIYKLSGLPKNDVTVGFDEINGKLFINADVSESTEEYMKEMIRLIWSHSELSTRTDGLAIEFVSTDDVK